jgi:ABC-type uncharacterized transport system substrate-binding protein
MKKTIKKRFLKIFTVVILLSLGIASYLILRSPYKFRGNGPIKIFVLNSYHPDFPVGLVNDSLKGFKDSLEKNGIKNYEIKEFNMDSDRKDSEELKIQAASEAKKSIDDWQPDLIFATNDDAQKYVISPYYLNRNIPIVFASVSNSPQNYNFDKAKNIAGVLQVPLFSSAFNFLKQLFPDVKKIAVISEDNSRWLSTVDELKKNQNNFSDIEFINWYKFTNYQEFQKNVLLSQNQVDAFFITPLDNLKDNSGKNVPFLTVTKWLVANSHLPEISLWQVPQDGLLAAVTYSPYEQGVEAGNFAYGILIKGQKPTTFGFKSLEVGDKYLNLARAESLGLKKENISSTILINSKIIEKFPWEK